jgi:hypothetical protein
VIIASGLYIGYREHVGIAARPDPGVAPRGAERTPEQDLII